MQTKLIRFHVLIVSLFVTVSMAFAQSAPQPDTAHANTPTPKNKLLAAAAAEKDDSAIDYVTSWIGNSFGGNDPNFPTQTNLHVQLDMDTIYVSPDGKVYTNAVWDEGGRPVSVFKDGRIISPLNNQSNSVNWQNGGGVAVAAKDDRIFVGYSPNGTGVGILNSKDMSNSGESLSGSSSLASSHGIFGMDIHNSQLFVTENDVNLVEVFDLKTLTLVDSFSVSNPVRIAVDHAGGFWVSHRDPTPLPATPQGNVFDVNGQMGLPTIDHYDSSGKWVNSITLPPGGSVGALCINPWGALLVADNGPDQNIKIYGNIEHDPILVTTFGEKGGNYAGPVRGRVGPRRFRGMTGIGTDASGNIYVSQSGFGLDMGVGHGVLLQSYAWWGDLNWQLDGLEFVSVGAMDPASEHDFYDAYHHFKMDWSQKPGQEAKYIADTYDRFKYPQDVRVTNIMSTGRIQYIQGKKFLLVGNQGGTLLEIYRFEDAASEIAIPCVAFDYGSFQNGAYQDFVVEPIDGEFIWRDLNGDGQMTLDEFTEPPNNLHRDGGYFHVDTHGDVWQVNYQAENPPYEQSIHLRRYLFQGFDHFGAPIYDFTHTQIYDALVDFPDLTTISGAVFHPNSEGGTLYVSGTSPAQGAFSKIVKIENWDKGNRKPKFAVEIPWDPDPNNPWSPNSFTVSDDFLFVDFWLPHYNLIFSAHDGAYVGKFVPGNDVGGVPNVGNTDEFQANTSFRRPNGEYIVVQEEDYQAKFLMYRWTPPGSLPKPPVPQSPSAVQGAANDEGATLTWTGGPDALIYNVSRSTTSGGPYTIVDTGVYQTTVADVGLTNGQTYYYVVSAEADTGLSSQNSSEVTVTATPVGTTYEAESASYANGPFVVTGCPLCSGGARLGAIIQGSSVTFSPVVVPVAGTYAVRIYEVNGNQPADWGIPTEPTIDVTVNGGTTITSPPLPFTGDWNTPGYTVVNLNLQKGANSIVLSVPAAAPSGDPDIDRIVVPFDPM